MKKKLIFYVNKLNNKGRYNMKPLFGGIVTDRCVKCSKVETHFRKQWCSIYRWPDRIWDRGICPFIYQKIVVKDKVRVGQQKQHRITLKIKE